MKKGWETSTLGDTCEMYQPKTISTKEMVAGGAYPVYGANGVIGRYDKYNHEEPQLLITCRGATCGTVNMSEPRSWITGNAMVVRPKQDSISMRFLAYLFEGGIDIRKAITGAAQPQITRTNLAPLEITFPKSLLEQRRIVALLDEAFEGLEKAKANAEKNVQNARELFESHLHQVFAEQTELVPLSSLADQITDGDHMPPPKAATGVPFITISDIKKDTRSIDFTNTFKVPREYFAKLKRNRKPRPGDVLYTVTGATLGIPVLVTNAIDFCFQRHIGLIRPNANTNSQWLSYALLSPQVFRQATSGSTGAAQKTVSLGVLRQIAIPKVPLREQQKMGTKLAELESETSRLTSLHQQKLAALNQLKQSLLHQAFTGQL